LQVSSVVEKGLFPSFRRKQGTEVTTFYESVERGGEMKGAVSVSRQPLFSCFL
jgi:hypothetical protein